ncbi:uncharacterized protein LOC107046694 [Diachasma alloeum]|uniref:uncharacterized protein LOC107046694 n=1 Tax=Diachasma alloeum TaxID=454923 RepID=UPI000738189B|nr:uncharacterized protein LOC107046694 [Diachasma alloeum]
MLAGRRDPHPTVDNRLVETRVKKPKVLTHTVKNLSSFPLTEAQVSILAKGHNFAVAPTKIPTQEIISQTETAIFHLPSEIGNEIRRKLSNILHKAKPPKQNITREERSALLSLKKNDNIVILPADKGNATVVMDKEAYSDKIKAMLTNSNIYKKLNKDPTSGVERKPVKLLKVADLSPETQKILSPRESFSPRLYGLPKIHKETIPLRPIVSSIGATTYQLARYLTKPLQILVGQNSSHIKNSQDFVNKLSHIQTSPGDLLVSFDVESLFTNVPIPDTLNIIKKPHKNPPKLLTLVEHCLTSTYFQFQGEFYEETFGAAMGSPISPTIANIFMEDFENKVLKSAPLKPLVWFRYVDDTLVLWKHGADTLPQFLNFINSQHPSIKFTMEIEEQKSLPFLDVLVHRNEDGSLGHRVYRKPTHTDRYIHAFSHHYPSQKTSVISSLMYRALTISQPEYLEAGVQHLDKALNNNEFQSKQVHRVLHKLKNKNSAESESADKVEHQKTPVLPYLQGSTDHISKVLQKHDIRTIFKPPTKIGQMLHSTKDGRPPLSLPGVYKIPCSCGKVYIGETGRRISTRIKEHQRCVKNGHFS